MHQAKLLMEAGLPSGTFSSANEAIAANRDVLVVPGSIASKQSRGANRLIYQGATPIVDDDSFSDVLFSVFGQMRMEDMRERRMDYMDDGCRKLFQAISAQPMCAEELSILAAKLCSKTDPSTWLMVQLAKMEGAGLIARYPDGTYGPKVESV